MAFSEAKVQERYKKNEQKWFITDFTLNDAKRKGVHNERLM